MDFAVRRMIDAPVDQVWRAWSDPSYVKQWWWPIGFTAPVAKTDFREGGTSLVGMRSPDGRDIFHTWTYRVIVPTERIEFVSKLADQNGNELDPAAIGLSPEIPGEVPHTSWSSGRLERTRQKSPSPSPAIRRDRNSS